MKPKIIFVGGIHGVGKSTLCNQISDYLKIESHSASNLIKSVSKEKLPSDKKIKQVSKNQDLLIQAVEKQFDPDKFYLLDGHFCLLNQSGDVTDIPLATFTDLSPIALVVLTNDPHTIQSQIKNRDGNEIDLSKISYFQSKEIERSKLVSKSLKIPLVSENPVTGMSHILSFIRELIGEESE